MQQDKANLIAVTSLSAAIWILLCIAGLIGFDGRLSIVVLVLIALFTYASIMLWRTILNENMAPLELTFWLFNTNYLLLPALSQSLNRTFYWSSYEAYKQETLLYACLIIGIGFLSFYIGGRLYRSNFRITTSSSKRGKIFARDFEETWGMLLFILAGLAVVVLSIARIGMTFFLANRSTGGSGLGGSVSDLGLLITLPRALAAGILLFSIFFIMKQMRQGRKVTLSTVVVLLSAISVNAIANYPLSIARFWFFGFLISLIWIVTPLRSALRRSAFVIGMSMLQFTLFPMYSQMTRGKGGGVGFSIESIRAYLLHGDFDGFQSIVNVTLYIQESGFELGRNIISAILFFIPRDFWEAKAGPLGAKAAHFMGYTYSNLSAPIYAELYADFGVLSLLLGMGFIGYGVQVLDRHYGLMIRSKQFGVDVLLAAVISGYLLIILRGSLLSVISSIATLFGVLIILSWLSMQRKQLKVPNNQLKQRE